MRCNHQSDDDVRRNHRDNGNDSNNDSEFIHDVSAIANNVP